MINNQEAWTKIIEIAKEAGIDGEESKKVEMAFTLLPIGGGEVLTCDICYENVQNQDMHICLKRESTRVICEDCWKKRAVKMSEGR